MSETTKKQRRGAYDQAVEHWEHTYAQNLANERPVYNRSGIEIDPLYARHRSSPGLRRSTRPTGASPLYPRYLFHDAPGPHLEPTATDRAGYTG